MDDDNLMEVNFTDLNLNPEPTHFPTLHRFARYDSLLSEFESPHDRIEPEERIRRLEAVIARARQRQRWREARNSMEMSYFPNEMMEVVDQRGILNENDNIGVVKRSERGRGCKRDSSHLVEKALETSSEVKKVDKKGGHFYECNICLEVAREPVLTCCGHLFCWSCFYQVSNTNSTSKECPVCKGEVSESSVFPIYGDGDSERVSEIESGLVIPPRPKACRVESVRKQRVTQVLSHIPVSEAFRRFRISIGAMGNQTQEGGSGILNSDTLSLEGQNIDSAGGHRIGIHQVSRVLSESAASRSSLLSALSNAERLVEDLETVTNNQLLQNDAQALSVDIESPFTRPSAVIQPNNEPQDSTPDIYSALPFTSSSLSIDTYGFAAHVLSTRASTDISLPVAPSSPSSSSLGRRSIMSRNLDLDSRDSHDSRRIRLF